MPACYGVDPELARFLFDSVSEQNKRLETGSGISTLAFALRQTRHIAITPNANEVESIRTYAEKRRVAHLECDAGDAAENFIHIKDHSRDRFSVADQQRAGRSAQGVELSGSGGSSTQTKDSG
jgi:hypothetical protein